MVTATGYVPAYDIPGFSTYGASGGLSRGQWSAQLFAQNLTNSGAAVDMGAGQYILVKVPLRPRVLGLTINYKFGEK
jgi:outer membrane receptor protein involved in Fe transport